MQVYKTGSSSESDGWESEGSEIISTAQCHLREKPYRPRRRKVGAWNNSFTENSFTDNSFTGNSCDRKGVFFSGRFDGALKEKAIRDVAAEVQRRAPFVPVLIVDAKNKEGRGYAELTMDFLTKMEVMVPFVFDNYGQWTGNVYSTHGEVTYCHEEQLRCLPLKLYATNSWPPLPPDTVGGGRKGPAQNGVFFRKDLVYKEFPIHSEKELEKSKTAMADYIIDYYLSFHEDLRPQDGRKKQDAKALTSRPRACDGTFAAGEHVQYHSQSEGRWLPARITKDLGEGKYEIDIRPRQPIPAQALKRGGRNDGPTGTLPCPAAEMPFKAGDAVVYYSKSKSTWVQDKVLRACGDGCYELEGRQGERFRQEALKSPEEVTSPRDPASPKLRSSVQSTGEAMSPASQETSRVRSGVYFSGKIDVVGQVKEEVRRRAPFVPFVEEWRRMELMVAFALDDYGRYSGNSHGTFREVAYCLEHQGEVQCLPLKLYSTKRWPPVPKDHDGGCQGEEQNARFFKRDLLYKDFPIHNMAELEASKSAMADCIIDRYLELHPELRCQDRRRGQHIPAQNAGGLPNATTGCTPAEKPLKEGDLVEHVSSDGSTTKVLKGVQPTKEAARPQSPASQSTEEPASPCLSPLSPSAPQKFAVGQHVMYMFEAKERGSWVASPTVILAAHDDGTFEVEAKKGARVPASLLWAGQSAAAAR